MQTKKQVLSVLCLALIASSQVTLQAMLKPIGFAKLLGQAKTGLNMCSCRENFHTSQPNNYKPYCWPKLQEPTNFDEIDPFEEVNSSLNTNHIERQKLMNVADENQQEKASYPSTFPATIRTKILFLITQNPEIAQALLISYQDCFGPNFLAIVLECALKNTKNKNIKTIELIKKLQLEKFKQLRTRKPEYNAQEDNPNNLLIEAIETENPEAIIIIFEHKDLRPLITFDGFHDAKSRAIEIDDQETLKVFDLIVTQEIENLKKKKSKKKVYDI